MKTISLCMIVKDEEKNIQTCILSVFDIVDEIIIVDTGSSDATKEIAGRYTDKIYDFIWCDDFSAARNEAFSKATKDYILWMDADDVVMPGEREKLYLLKQELSEKIDVVMMKYNIAFDAKGNVTFSYYRERLLKRSCNFRWSEPVHEYIQFGGNVIMKDIAITHLKTHPSGNRNILIYENIIKQGRKLSTRGLYYYGKELYEHKRVKEAIKYLAEFLNCKDGWVEDKINACFLLASCYKQQGEEEKMLEVLYRSFIFELPRAEICCMLGLHYLEKVEYKKAIYWYTVATSLEYPKDSWGFVLEDYWTYIPNMQLCLCYDLIGDVEKAYKYNEIAAKYKPDSPAVFYNREYFKRRREN